LLTEPYNSLPKSGNPILTTDAWRPCTRLATMAVTVLLELRFKPDEVAAGRELMGRTLETTRAFDGNLRTDVMVDEDDETHWMIYELWDTVEHDEAYRAFRAGEGKVTQLPPLLAAPPVKTRYTTTDV
jgi:quinol monooxygenase YgiN